MDWQAALKNAMRQAPDCILIGEIRDKETMQAAIAYSQTGHLCLATLHANNSYHALNRIISFFPAGKPPGAVPRPLRVAACHHLATPGQEAGRQAGIPTCEIMLNTRHISELIERGEVQGIKDAMEQTLAPGSQTFEQDLFKPLSASRHHHHRRSAGQRRFADQPVLADQQFRIRLQATARKTRKTDASPSISTAPATAAPPSRNSRSAWMAEEESH
jgi:Tfp pilus assembly ATPase PilU